MTARIIAALLISIFCAYGCYRSLNGVWHGVARRRFRAGRRWPITVSGKPFLFVLLMAAWLFSAFALAYVWFYAVKALVFEK